MSKYASIGFMDGGFTYFKANITKIVLLSQYSVGDSYATVNTTNKLAEVASVSGDYPVTGADGASRVMTTPAKTNVTATDNAPGSPDLHVAFLSGSEVLMVTDEISNQEITSGNDYDIPSTTYTRPQPV